MTETSATLHASCVALASRAVLISGASGSGKSALSLRLMALGAGLVADDGVRLERRGKDIICSAPDPIAGMIEARGIGLLRAEAHPPARLFLAVDLDHAEPHRLPPVRHFSVLGLPVRLILGKDSSHLEYGILQILKSGALPQEH